MNAAQGAAMAPILVIEDEPAVMSFLLAALKRGGYGIAPAASGSEGIHMLSRGEYLGVITDMRTPGGVSGADVHAWILANRPQMAARVILITGDTVNEETAAIMRQTGAPCIEKPFRVQQLIAMVERVFGGRP